MEQEALDGIVAGGPQPPRFTPVDDDYVDELVEGLVPPAVETTAERVIRLEAERDRLRESLAADELEDEVQQLRRLRFAGRQHAVPRGAGLQGPMFRPESEADAQSLRDSETSLPVRTALSSRPRLKEPTPFKGNTIKESRNFIRELEVTFAITAGTYPTDREKVLYGVMFLAGEAHEAWHQQNSINDIDDYTFQEFKDFVRNAVGDPVNRSISVTLQYDRLQQKESQSVQAFATEISVCEDQMPAYTEAQRVRHFLAKLQPTLRSSIIKFHTIPATRRELIALASRIENTDREPHKRSNPDAQDRKGNKKAKHEPSSHSKNKRDASDTPAKTATSGSTSTFDKSKVECYGCGKKGHYKGECKSKHLWADGDKHAVRQVAAEPGEPEEEGPPTKKAKKGKGKSRAKDRSPV